MFAKLLQNHILTNLTFLLVLILGWMSYQQLPREQDPSINFNWVQVWAYWPGATAPDVEARITKPLEDGIKRVADVKFVSSTSREGVSSILIRFDDISDAEFDQRMTDLRRELQARQDELPASVKQPEVFELSSSKAFPTATLVIFGQTDEGSLQRAAQSVRDDLGRLVGVDDVLSVGDRGAELQVEFLPDQLLGLGISAVDLADTVKAYFQDLAAGDVQLGDQKWLIHLTGTSNDPSYVGAFPIASEQGEVLLRSIADVKRTREDPRELVLHEESPAVLLLVYKKGKVNNLKLLEKITDYIEQQNQLTERTGVQLKLLDDQTEATKAALGVMERNAVIGLLFVMLVTWAFLGFKMALFTSTGIAFVLAGTFGVMSFIGETLNISILLGVVISLGMLVDDAVVVVEAAHYRLRRGVDTVQAVREALREVVPPVTTAVLTTVAAFLPLMLLPGVLGDFMRVVPLVVSVALIISLVEAFWILPSHIIEFEPNLVRRNKVQLLRNRLTRSLRNRYANFLIRVFRRPKQSLYGISALLLLVVVILVSGLVRIDFFASDHFRLFYVNVEMQPGTTLTKTSGTLNKIQQVITAELRPGEARGVVHYAGQQFTDKEILTGDDRGQIFVSLNPATSATRDIQEIIDALDDQITAIPGPINVSFLKRKMGPPTSKPISLKIRGDDIAEIRRALDSLKNILADMPGVNDVADDDTKGGMELRVQLNPDTITRSGLNPQNVTRAVHLYVDGEIVANTQYNGERLDVRVRAKPVVLQDIETFMAHTVGLKEGGGIALGELLTYEEQATVSNIRHQNFRRAVTLEASLDHGITDTLSANRLIKQRWLEISAQFPGISLDFAGEMDDIQDSLGAMLILFVLGLGLIYLVLGTQFNSYLQPLIVLAVVPLAFVGVVLGLFVSSNPLSLFTLYGAVALAGIAANDAIVLISTANKNLDNKMPIATAITYAARRRVMPITITSLTTIAGLFSLAVGLGGSSLIWGPVATTIVWGLAVSTLLTLFIIPLGYLMCYRGESEQVNILGVSSTPGGLLGDLRRRVSVAIGISQQFEDLDLLEALKNPEQKERYDRGILTLAEGDTSQAIKCFEQLAQDQPKIKEFNFLAAQSLIYHMQKQGWDVGFIVRARRYLNKLQQLGYDGNSIMKLEKAYALLEKDNPDIDN
ncbi:MAG: efflux RND transporter permease subunit [Gammaproteobacteria bacterium]|nr:efflux RND transporter permease subunit [Gammaproteobacteria bacterium]